MVEPAAGLEVVVAVTAAVVVVGSLPTAVSLALVPAVAVVVVLALVIVVAVPFAVAVSLLVVVPFATVRLSRAFGGWSAGWSIAWVGALRVLCLLVSDTLRVART